jgi:quaternary ammonium compound-resistance protein SugE
VSWIVLIVAGFLEVAWASVLPATKGFTRLVPSVAFVVALAASMAGLEYATRSIPLGTGYAVWVGIGSVGTVIVGIFVYGDAATVGRLFFLGLLVLSIVGLNLTGGG